MIFHRAISTFFGSLILSTRPMRFTRRIQWVSVTMAGFPNTSPMIRLALLRPTPGRASSLSKSSGTFPPYSSRSILMQALMSLALLFPSPQGWTISSMASAGASARAFTSGNFSYNFSTTTFTRASVHWAARRTLTSSFHAWSYSSVQSAWGYSSFNLSMIFSARCFFVIVFSLSDVKFT